MLKFELRGLSSGMYRPGQGKGAVLKWGTLSTAIAYLERLDNKVLGMGRDENTGKGGRRRLIYASISLLMYVMSVPREDQV